MRWSDGDINTLREQWGKLSASEIARLLGSRVSRNAVIGKANRLGLSDGGGTQSSRAQDKQARQTAPRPSDSRKNAANALLKDKGITVARGQSARGIAAKASVAASVEKLAKADPLKLTRSNGKGHDGKPWIETMPVGEKVRSGPQQECRWPMGDPRSHEFHFCGCAAMAGLPYCAEHARQAYQGSLNRRRQMVESPSGVAQIVRPYGEPAYDTAGEAA